MKTASTPRTAEELQELQLLVRELHTTANDGAVQIWNALTDEERTGLRRQRHHAPGTPRHVLDSLNRLGLVELASEWNETTFFADFVVDTNGHGQRLPGVPS